MIFVVNACAACPFYFESDRRRCTIATPKNRPIETEDPRPFWCPLGKEQVIVREKSV